MRNLLLIVFLVGCGGGATDECPTARPADRSACSYVNATAPSCYYYDACTSDGTGVVAQCEDGRWQVGFNLILRQCPREAPRDGDACPCAEGGRQQSPCDYTCDGGGSLRATCDSSTLKWTSSAPAGCTPQPRTN